MHLEPLWLGANTDFFLATVQCWIYIQMLYDHFPPSTVCLTTITTSYKIWFISTNKLDLKQNDQLTRHPHQKIHHCPVFL